MPTTEKDVQEWVELVTDVEVLYDRVAAYGAISGAANRARRQMSATDFLSPSQRWEIAEHMIARLNKRVAQIEFLLKGAILLGVVWLFLPIILLLLLPGRWIPAGRYAAAQTPVDRIQLVWTAVEQGRFDWNYLFPDTSGSRDPPPLTGAFTGETRDEVGNPSRRAIVEHAYLLESEPQFSIPAEVVLSICEYESGGSRQYDDNGDLVQGDNGDSIDWGMCQINDRWHPDKMEMAQGSWQGNQRAAFMVADQCWKAHPGDIRGTLGCYNGSGPYDTYANRVMVKYEAAWWEPYLAELEDQPTRGESITSCYPREGFDTCETLLIMPVFEHNMIMTVQEMVERETPSCGGDGVDTIYVPAGTRWSFNGCHPSGYATTSGDYIYNKGSSGGYIIGAGACNVATLYNAVLMDLGIPTERAPHVLQSAGGVYVPISKADGSHFSRDESVVIESGSADLTFGPYPQDVELRVEIYANSMVLHGRIVP
ncbi:hypothetical protein GF360_00170 [candidate division WWE3 bacterium]|nr:hypothetical protein [candidate division WWE3 bacterium]